MFSLDRQHCTGSHCRVAADSIIRAEKVDFLEKVFLAFFLGYFFLLGQFGPVALWLGQRDDVVKFVDHSLLALSFFGAWRNLFDKNAFEMTEWIS